MSDLKTNLQEILQEKQDKIIPENIKKDVQIFDVIGTMNGGIDTSDATATADDIAQNKTAYVNGEKIIGTVFTTESGEQRLLLLPNNFTEDETKIILPAMDNGIYYRAGTILYFNKINLRNKFGITADKIKSGETILGLEGTVEDVDDYISLPEGETSIKILDCIKKIPLIDTSNVTNMRYMFQDCTALTEIPLLDTSKVTSMSYMFQDCTALTTIPLLDTSKVTSMSYMFNGATALTTIPLLNTSAVTNMSSMFYNCVGLTTIPLLNTSAVTNMSSMFQDCTALTEIPLLDTSNVTSMNNMFQNCTALTTIPQLNTSNVINMNNMFRGCSSLVTIPLLNTSAVTNMSNMFYNCVGLTEVPQLDISNVTSMSYMFNGATALSNDSLNNILAMLTNATAYTGTKTLKYIGLS